MVELTSGKTNTQPILILMLVVGFSVIIHKMVFTNSVTYCLWSAHILLLCISKHNMWLWHLFNVLCVVSTSSLGAFSQTDIIPCGLSIMEQWKPVPWWKPTQAGFRLVFSKVGYVKSCHFAGNPPQWVCSGFPPLHHWRTTWYVCRNSSLD